MKIIQSICTVLGFSFLSLNSFSQSETFRMIEVDIPVLGYAMPQSGGGGILVGFETRYNHSDQLAFGINYQQAIMAGGDEFTSVSALAHYGLVGEYYLNANTFRPFGGLGLSGFAVANVGVSSDFGTIEEIQGGFKPGIVPRIGFELGHWRLAAEYNLIFGTNTYNPSYIAIKTAITIGGGKK